MGQKSRRELIVMGALTLERAQKAEARAEKAEQQLAEVQKANAHWHARITALLNDKEASGARLDEAQQQIERLEKLVPDADLVLKLLRDDYDTNEMREMVALQAAIREYREGK